MTLCDRFARFIMRGWYQKILFTASGLPSPHDEPTVSTPGEDPDMVLLFGNGPAFGWGVTSHDLSLTGHLAREVSRGTGRPCTVHFIGHEMMNAGSSATWLGEHDLSRYDAIVIMIGLNDAARLTPVNAWRTQLGQLLDATCHGSKLSAQTLVTGIPPVRSIGIFDSFLGGIAATHALRLNNVTDTVVAHREDTTFLPLDAVTFPDDRPHGSTETYRQRAITLTDALIPLLDNVRCEEKEARTDKAIVSESWQWSGAGTFVKNAAEGGSQALRTITDEAQATFGVDLAVVTLLDGTQLWYGVHTNLLPAAVPRALTYCDVAAASDGPLIVPDSRTDARFRDNPFIDISGSRFYAGHPLRSSTGDTIGTFCLHNLTPRPASTVPLDVLAGFARRAEEELHTYESTPPSPVETRDN